MKKSKPVEWGLLDDEVSGKKPPVLVPSAPLAPRDGDRQVHQQPAGTGAFRIGLPGLDAQNPLGFLAALGLLRVLDHARSPDSSERPRLSFVEEGGQVARIDTHLTFEQIVEVVLEDAATQRDNLALQLAYDDDGHLVAPTSADATRDLKPAPMAARALLDSAAVSDRRTADLAAAFFSELVQDNNGNTKPTALHFTAGQQSFLQMVEDLRTGIRAEDVLEALRGPWRNESALPSLSWDASVARNYALRASNPSKEKRGSVAGANWLAAAGLSFFPVHVRRGRLETTCVQGGWKDSVLTWPLWAAPATASTVAALLRSNRRWSSRERAAMGITQLLSSRILRSDQGGYGSFCPSEVVLPA